MLDTFVHDPLVNWRLIAPKNLSPLPETPANITLRESSASSRKSTFSNSSYNKSYKMDLQNSSKTFRYKLAEINAANLELENKSLVAINRVKQKLSGTDFDNIQLSVRDQVLYIFY